MFTAHRASSVWFAGVLLAGFALAALPAYPQDGQRKEESTGTVQVKPKKIRAEDLAQEFLRDPQAARKAYITTPKEVKLGKIAGVPILSPVYGEVEKVQGRDVYLKTGTPTVRVVLQVSEAPKDPQAVGKTAAGTGFVRTFQDGVITVQVHELQWKKPAP